MIPPDGRGADFGQRKPVPEVYCTLMGKSAEITESAAAKGLEGVIALESALSSIDGNAGSLVYAGYDIADLARNATFEEVAFLLWHGRVPDTAELAQLNQALQAARLIPPAVMDLLLSLPEGAEPMAVLRTAVSLLAVSDPEGDEHTPDADLRRAIRLTAVMPTIIAAFARIRRGERAVAPSQSGSLAADFLYMLNGEAPGEAAERTFDVCLILHAEHGLNASTFAARVIAATLSDMYSATTGAIGALKGPLHGGANTAVMRTLLKIDEQGADPGQYVKDALANKERIMGFGHRVYRTLDPRAAILREMVEAVAEERGSRKWFDMSVAMMETMEREKGLYPNVDFFSASLYYMLGIDIDLFTPMFAMSRVTGWTAHMLEQWRDNRLIRPRSRYVGPTGLRYPRKRRG